MFFCLYSITTLLVTFRLKVHHSMDLLRGVAQEALEVTHKSVDIALPRCLEDNVLIIVVAEAAGQLLIVHFWLVLPDAPPPRHLVRVYHLELPAIARPGNEALARLVREQLQQELPQLDGS